MMQQKESEEMSRVCLSNQRGGEGSALRVKDEYGERTKGGRGGGGLRGPPYGGGRGGYVVRSVWRKGGRERHMHYACGHASIYIYLHLNISTSVLLHC